MGSSNAERGTPRRLGAPNPWGLAIAGLTAVVPIVRYWILPHWEQLVSNIDLVSLVCVFTSAVASVWSFREHAWAWLQRVFRFPGEVEQAATLVDKVDGLARELRTDVNGLARELRTDVDGLARKLRTDVDGLARELRTDVNGLAGKVNGLSGKVDGLAQDLHELQCDVREVKSSQDRAEGQVQRNMDILQKQQQHLQGQQLLQQQGLFKLSAPTGQPGVDTASGA